MKNQIKKKKKKEEAEENLNRIIRANIILINGF